MPMYDYKCVGCGREFEKIVLKYDTEEKQACPDCGADSNFCMPIGSRRVKFLFNYSEP